MNETLVAPTPTQVNPTFALNEALRGLRHWNVPVYNADPAKVALLGSSPALAMPLVGAVSYGTRLVARSVGTGEYVTLEAGTQLLVVAVTTGAQPRLLVDALTPGGKNRQVELTPEQALGATGEITGYALLYDVTGRLRLMQDTLKNSDGSYTQRAVFPR